MKVKFVTRITDTGRHTENLDEGWPKSCDVMEKLRLKRKELSHHFLIRPINPGNLDEEQAVVDLIQTCYRSNLGWSNEAGIVRGQRITLPVLQREASAPDGVLLVVEERGTGDIVGCVKTDLIESSFGGVLSEKMGHFGTFAVAPRHQGKGLGSYLLSRVEERCRMSGVSKM